MITIENIHKAFGSQVVLNGVSMEIPHGQSVVVMGKSGVGKSVLLKLIMRLLAPDEGRIIIDDHDINTLTNQEMDVLRLKFGMLFQSAALFDSMNVADNVGIGLRTFNRMTEAELDEITTHCLELVGLTEVGQKYPAELSGGMRKRVGLARAVAMNPRYILYDEPTTGLDPVTSAQISELIKKLQRDLEVTSIIVTHDIPTGFYLADQIALLNEGNFSFLGSVEEMKRSENELVRQFIGEYSNVESAGTDHADDIYYQ